MRTTAAVLLTAALAGTGISGCSSTSQGNAPPPPPADGRNVVVIVTDDQRADSLRYMPRVQELMVDRGIDFTESVVNYSLCCPSRATLMTGQYAHNHRVLGNKPPDGGFDVFQELHGEDNLATWLQDAGYRTALVGKYFNGYGEEDPEYVPAGWDRWVASVPPGQRVYDYTLNRDGALSHHGTDPEDFKEDVLTDNALEVLDELSGSGSPFYLQLAYTAPHTGGPKVNPQPPSDCSGTAKPAPRFAATYDAVELPEPPEFNEADVSDKPPGTRDLDPLTDEDVIELGRKYRCYLESLLAVDDGVGRIVDKLKELGELDDTLLVFTSDNGFFFGEHRIKAGKVRAFEPSITVPLVMSGPGVDEGETIDRPVSNADLAPTILDAAGLEPRPEFDGISLLPFTAGEELPPRDLLIETRYFAGLRTDDFVLIDHLVGAASGESELYDLRRDPGQLENLAGRPDYAALQERLEQRLLELRACAGADCRP